MDGDAGVEEGDVAAGGFGLGEGVAGVGFVEEDLALEVGGLDEVAVDEGEGADSSACEERCGGRAHGSAAYDGDVGGGKTLLADSADAGKENLTGVSVFIRDYSGGIGDCVSGGGYGVELSWGESCGDTAAHSFKCIVLRSIGNCGGLFIGGLLVRFASK